MSEARVVYTFQCPVCYIFSGIASINPDDAPTCCDGERMIPTRHDYNISPTIDWVLTTDTIE